jgi:hypothetical protein
MHVRPGEVRPLGRGSGTCSSSVQILSRGIAIVMNVQRYIRIFFSVAER